MQNKKEIDPVKNLPLLMISVYKVISENRDETSNEELKNKVAMNANLGQELRNQISKKEYFDRQIRFAQILLVKKGAIHQLDSGAWGKKSDYFVYSSLNVDDIVEAFLTGGSGYEPIYGIITKNTEASLSRKLHQMDENNLQKFCTRIINHCVFEKTWKCENSVDLPYPKYTLKYFPKMGGIRFKFECCLYDDADTINKLIDEFVQNDLYEYADYMILVAGKNIDEETKQKLLQQNVIVIDLHILVCLCIGNDIGFYPTKSTFQIDQEYFKRYIKKGNNIY